MTATKTLLNRVMVVGAVLLILPLITFSGEPGPHGKLVAFRAMLVSLAGLSILASALWWRLLILRRERLDQQRAEHDDELLTGMVRAKRTALKRLNNDKK